MSTPSFQFCPLSSGSSGNVIYVAYGMTRFLIDCGKSGRTIESGLASIGVDPMSLQFILLTHSHRDHTCGVGVMSRRYGLPIYATGGTWEEVLRDPLIGSIRSENIRVFPSAGTQIAELSDDMEISAFAIPHDAREPVGYRIHCGRHSAVVVTDLGFTSLEVKAAALGAELILLESNHDLDMLKNGRYPASLKRRILGNYGHLSNLAAGIFAVELVKSGTRRIYLGHLSRENNTPEIALASVRDGLKRGKIDPDRDVDLILANRDCPTEMTEW